MSSSSSDGSPAAQGVGDTAADAYPQWVFTPPNPLAEPGSPQTPHQPHLPPMSGPAALHQDRQENEDGSGMVVDEPETPDLKQAQSGRLDLEENGEPSVVVQAQGSKHTPATLRMRTPASVWGTAPLFRTPRRTLAVGDSPPASPLQLQSRGLGSPVGVPDTAGSTLTNLIEAVTVDLSLHLGRFRQTIRIRVPTRFLNVTVVVFGLVWFLVAFAPHLWASMPIKEDPNVATAEKFDAVSKCLQNCWGLDNERPERRLGCVTGCLMAV